MSLRSGVFVVWLAICASLKGFGQAPSIMYKTPNVYATNLPITPLSPTNTGGAVVSGSTIVLSSGFVDVRGVALDAAGNVYVADLGADDVIKIPAGSSSQVILATGFNHPSGVAIDKAGNIYVADNGNNAIKKIPVGGGAIVTIGSGFLQPYSVVVDASGNVYVTDTGNKKVKEILAGTNTVVSLGVSFAMPTGIAIDAAGNLFVTDRGNNAIDMISPDGNSFITLATASGNPNGICVDVAGDVYFADSNNTSVVEIPVSRTGLTSIGSGLVGPDALAVDANGDIYAGDNGDGVVREIKNSAGYTISPLLPAGLSFNSTTGVISGTPTAATPTTIYTVNAFNASGTGTTKLSITVNKSLPPVISYASPQVYNYGVPISPLSPTNTGAEVTSYAGYSLEKGLSLNTTTGVISGTPTQIVTGQSDTVIASNPGGTSMAIIKITVNPPAAPAISYSSPQVYIAATAITPLTPDNTGGLIVSYTISPALPVGLTINAITGVISGTPSALSAAANYTVTASNLGGKGTSVINIKVIAPAVPKISYSSPKTYTAEAAITPLIPVSTGGAVASYFISPALPAGLSIDAVTGIISGTPTALSPATTYTVTASNLGGSGTSVVNLTVTAPALPKISYSTPQVYINGTPIAPLSPVNTGGIADNYQISPSLPAGLSFDGTTGIISGTPTTVTPAANYIVTASNLGGCSTTTLNIIVNPPPQANLSYPSPQVYTYGVAITPVSPVNTGAPVVGAYSISPALPNNLKFNSLTGVISGTPTALSPATIYSVFVYNGGGSDVTTFSLTVNAPALPVISYSPSIHEELGKTLVAIVPQNAGGLANNYKISPLLPRGLVFTALTGVISGTPDVTFPATKYTVIASNISGADTTSFTFQVTAPAKPRISYPTPNVFTLGAAIASVSPTNSGDPVTTTATTGSGFNDPRGLAVDATGNIYVADNGNAAIKKIPLTNAAPVAVGSGFIYPTGVAIDATGNLYIADYHGAIYKLAVGSGTMTTFTTSAGSPYGLAFDAAGNLYVSDFDGNTVRKINPAGGVTTIATGFNEPCGLAVDPSGNVYVADRGNNEVKEILTSGGPPIVVGSNFNTPVDVAVDKAGNVYIADFGNGVVKKMPVGGGDPVVFYKGGSGAAPFGITIDPKGNLYISTTYNNNVIEIYNPSGYAISPVLPLGLAFDPLTGIISGTPAISSPATNYAVTAANAGGADTTALNITVNPIKTLASLSVSAGVLSPAFKPTTTIYTVAVLNAQTSITVTPTPTDAGATITVNGIAVAPGVASQAVPLVVGSNTINLVLTDAGSTQNYTVTVTRGGILGNANLSNLTVSKGTLSPAFNGDSTNYTIMVSNGNSSVSLTPTTSDIKATVTVNGMSVISGAPSGAIALSVGNNPIPVVVTASDGTTKQTYTVNVIRPSTNSKLANLKLNTGTLSPVFNPATNNYSASVNNSTASITVTPTVAVTGSNVKINGTSVVSGTSSAAIALSVGANTITVIVTAQDGITTNTYTVVVARATASNNANLAGLTPSKGTLSPAFATATTSYTDMVTNGTASVTLTPTLADANATVTVNGTGVKSGSPSGAIALSVGSNAVIIIVTAEDGTTKNTFTVNVIRPSTNARLSALTISTGTLAPVFNTNTTSYTASVTNTTTSLTVTPTVSVTGATIKVNGTTVASGTTSGAITLAVGPNTITTVVTAQDGITIDTYTLTVTRPANGNIPDASVSVDKPTESLQLADDGIIVHQGISPNGDGINDFLQIDNISNYPENHLSIMNREGQLVYETNGYDNATKAFDGHSNKNGQMQLPGTYFYSLDYTAKGIVKHKTGFLVLKY